MCEPGRVVASGAGRDKGELFWVVGVREDGYLLLADGKRRKASRPKAKKPRHVVLLDAGDFQHPTADKLQRVIPVSDRELRRALCAFKEEMRLGKG